MPGFKITSFKGIAPLIPDDKLSSEAATVANNCKVNTTELASFGEAVLDSTLTKTGPIQTIFKYRTDSDEDLWFHWADDVDVVNSPIINDTEYKVYYTGSTEDENTAPRITNNELSRAGITTDYPATEYNLGVPSPLTSWGTAPTAPATPAATSVNILDSETRYYVYTYVDYSDSESAPSEVSPSVTWYPGQSINVPVTFDSVSHSSIKSARIYVTQTGTQATDFQFAGEILAGVANFIDDGSTRAEILPTKTWVMPDPAMVGLTAMANGIMVGFKGNTLMFSEAYIPYAWPVEYQISIDYDIVGLAVTGDLLVVGTKGTPYVVSGAQPAAMSITKLDMEQSCVSKRSMVSVLDGVMYASPDGLMFVTTSGSDLITKNLITRDQWNADYNPSTIHAYQHDNKYYAFYTSAGFIFDPTSQHLIHINVNATGGFNDLIEDTLYLVIEGNKIHKWDAADTKLEYTWKSKTFVAPKPVNFGAARVRAETYPITFELLANGEVKTTKSVTNDRGFRLHSNYVATDFEVRLKGTGTVKSVTIADTISELGAVE